MYKNYWLKRKAIREDAMVSYPDIEIMIQYPVCISTVMPYISDEIEVDWGNIPTEIKIEAVIPPVIQVTIPELPDIPNVVIPDIKISDKIEIPPIIFTCNCLETDFS